MLSVSAFWQQASQKNRNAENLYQEAGAQSLSQAVCNKLPTSTLFNTESTERKRAPAFACSRVAESLL